MLLEKGFEDMPCHSSRRCASKSAIDIDLLEDAKVPHNMDANSRSDVVRDVRHIRLGPDVVDAPTLDKT